MCGKAFDPRFIYAWPNARYAVMGGKQAAKVILDINIAALKRAGQEPDAEEMEALRDKVQSAYDTSTDIRYAAGRLWVDGIINPSETRKTLIQFRSKPLRDMRTMNRSEQVYYKFEYLCWSRAKPKHFSGSISLSGTQNSVTT